MNSPVTNRGRDRKPGAAGEIAIENFQKICGGLFDAQPTHIACLELHHIQ